MRIFPRQQGGPRRCTHRDRGVPGKTQTRTGQGVNVGRGNFAAKAAKVRETQIVEQDDHHIGRALRCTRGFAPPRLGVFQGFTNRALIPLGGVGGRLPRILHALT